VIIIKEQKVFGSVENSGIRTYVCSNRKKTWDIGNQTELPLKDRFRSQLLYNDSNSADNYYTNTYFSLIGMCKEI
jgi:hypothetical protein